MSKILNPVHSLFAGVKGNILFESTLKRLQGDKDLCLKGPAAVLQRILEVMQENAACCPALYEPLARSGTAADVARKAAKHAAATARDA